MELTIEKHIVYSDEDKAKLHKKAHALRPSYSTSLYVWQGKSDFRAVFELRYRSNKKYKSNKKYRRLVSISYNYLSLKKKEREFDDPYRKNVKKKTYLGTYNFFFFFA